MIIQKPNVKALWLEVIRVWIVAAVLLALICFWRSEHKQVAALPPPAAPRLEVSSQTLKPQQENTITVKATGERPSELRDEDHARVSIAAIGFHDDVSVNDLFSKGVTVEVPRGKVGAATMTVKSEMLTASIPIVFAGESSAAADSRPIWAVVAGKPSLGAQGHFELPITLQLQTVKNNELVPIAAERDYVFVLKNITAAKDLGQLNLQKGSAISQQIWIPMEPSLNADLVASDTVSTAKTNPLTVSWNRNAPDLSIAVAPEKSETFATYVTRAKVGIYLSYNGRLVPSPYDMSVIASGPATVTVSPANPITMATAADVTTVDLCSTTFGARSGRVTFVDPRSGTSATAEVLFIFPWAYYVIALLSGPAGALFAERKSLTAMSGTSIAICALCGAVGGLFVYLAALSGWSVVSESVTVLVGVPSALLVGFAGGTSSDAVVAFVRSAILHYTPAS